MYEEITINLQEWEATFREFILSQNFTDLSHGIDHIERVVASTKRIGESEGARPEITIPAAWLHDCVMVEKNSPERSRASRLAAEKGREFLVEKRYPGELIGPICHAIEAHSFSAGIPPQTIEAKVVQDADRLDALGAVGLARCLMTGERMGIPLYKADDPFCTEREPDDSKSAIDHFYVKLFTLPETMQTEAGKSEAIRRAKFLEEFLDELRRELPEEVSIIEAVREA
ncbi:MAG: HD domain-containing protein [Candidatus Kapaibacterium sp.]